MGSDTPLRGVLINGIPDIVGWFVISLWHLAFMYMEGQFGALTFRKDAVRYIILTAFVLVLLCGFWNLGLVIYPSLGILAFILIFFVGRTGVIKIRTLDIGLLAVLILEIVGYCFSNYRDNSFSFLGNVTVVLAVYATWVLIDRDVRCGQLLLMMVVMYGGLLSLATILQYIKFNFDVRTHGFADVYHVRNQFGPFGVPVNDWSSIVFLFFILCCNVTIAHWRSKNLRRILLVNCVVVGMSLVLTFSRGTYISLSLFLLSLSLLFVVLFRHHPGKILRHGLSVLVVLFILTIPVFKPFLATVKFLQTTSQVRSADGRLEIINSSFPLVKSYLWTGVGAGNFAMYYSRNNQQRSEDDTIVLSSTNNTGLQLLIDKGLVGIIGYISIFALLLVRLFNVISLRGPVTQAGTDAAVCFLGICAFLFKELTFSSLLSNDSVLLLFSILLALSRRHTNIVFARTLTMREMALRILPFLVFSCWFCLESERRSSAERANERFITAYSEDRNDEAQGFINHAIEREPGNAVYHLNKGQHILAGYDPPFSAADILSWAKLEYDHVDRLEGAIEEFKTVIQINPNDPLAFLNLGWVSFYSGSLDLARKYFEAAYQTDPQEPLYNLSKALFHFYQCEDSMVALHLEKAVHGYPAILGSDLWEEMERRSPHVTSLIERNLVNYYKMKLENSNSPIIRAKFAKVLQDLGCVQESRSLLYVITADMPNLSRPWLYLGDLVTANDTLQANFYQKAQFLDPDDFLPKLRLAQFYEYYASYQNAISYYKMALIKMTGIPIGSITAKFNRYYLSNFAPVYCFPKDLIYLSVPEVNPKTYCLRLSHLYGKVGDEVLKHQLYILSTKQGVEFEEIIKLIYAR